MKSITLRSMNSLPIVKDIPNDKCTRVVNKRASQLHGLRPVNLKQGGDKNRVMMKGKTFLLI